MNDNEFRATIAKYLKLRVKNHKDVIRNTQISESTYYRKMANPQTFNLREMRLIFDYLKVPKDERIF